MRKFAFTLLSGLIAFVALVHTVGYVTNNAALATHPLEITAEWACVVFFGYFAYDE